MSQHLHYTHVYRGDWLRVDDVRCRPRSCDCGDEESASMPALAVVRRGVFRLHIGRRDYLLDPTQVAIFDPRHSYRVSHPVGHGDDCTSLTFSPRIVRDVQSANRPRDADREHLALGRPAARGSPTILLAIQALRRRHAAGAADPVEFESLCLAVLAASLKSAANLSDDSSDSRREATSRAHRQTTDDVRSLLAMRFAERLTLAEIARAVHCSPFHLLRLFRRSTGLPIHRYLTRLRLMHALGDLVECASGLAGVALDAGFSSHAHFSDSFRREFGVSPSEVRGGLTRERMREISKILKDPTVHSN